MSSVRVLLGHSGGTLLAKVKYELSDVPRIGITGTLLVIKVLRHFAEI